MTTQAGHAAVRGAAWLLAGQVAVSVAQLLYAALTGRLVTPTIFGAYAVAMSAAPIILLLANAGIGSAVARASVLSRPQVRALVTLSLGLGVAAGGVVWLLARPWSSLWGNAAASDAIRWCALGVLPAPLLGLLMGLSRRSGNFRRLSLASTVGGFVGIVAGSASVWHYRSAASLVTMPVVTVTIQTALLLTAGGLPHPGRLRGDVLEHLNFGAKVVLANGMGYLSGAIPQLALSRGVGAAMLGSWNRATVTTQVPLEMIQNSLVQVIYPEFRHDIGTTDRSSRLWLDLLALVAWVMIPLGAMVGACSYFALPAILGPGWQTAASLAPWLALASAANMPGVVLSSALEATGRFGGIWVARVASLAVMVTSATTALLSHSVTPVILGTYAGIGLSHAIQLRYAHRHAIFPVHALLCVYLKVFSVTGSFGLASVLWLDAISETDDLVTRSALLLGLLIVSAVLWLARFHLPPLKIARRYGIIKR